MASKPLFLALLSVLFNFLSWPSFVLLLPLYASFWTMESQSHSKNQQCLIFWVLFALSSFFPPNILFWLPCWPYVKGVVTFLLVVPSFSGASYVYKSSLRPYLVKGSRKFFLMWSIVFFLTRKCLSLCRIFIFLHRICFSSSRHSNFADGTNDCQLISKLHYDNRERDRKRIPNEVQKECVCERCYKQNVRAEQYKTKEEARAKELALTLRCNSSYVANRQNAAADLVENWSGLLGPGVGSIRLCSWRKPEVGWVKLNTDGSIIDGEKAGLGGLLRDYKGDPVCGFVSKVNLNDIFLVELCAIWKGLVLARGIGINVVWVESDSMSAVKTINRKQFRNGKADKYLEQIWRVLNKFDKQQVSHSWRESNRAADYLSKMVSKTDDVVLRPCEFPLSLVNIIEDDAQGRIYIRR